MSYAPPAENTAQASSTVVVKPGVERSPPQRCDQARPESRLTPHQLPIRHAVRLIGIRSLPLVRIFYMSLEIPLGTTDFAVLL